jgi:hypothetical protein
LASRTAAIGRLNDLVLLIPQDEHLAALMDRAAAALEAAGISVEDFLANLPAARDDVVVAFREDKDVEIPDDMEIPV